MLSKKSSLMMASLVSMEQVSGLNPQQFIAMVSMVAKDPMIKSWSEWKPVYRDRSYNVHHLDDNNLILSIAAIGSESAYWKRAAKMSPHPLVRASLAKNSRVLASNRVLIRWLSLFDRSPVVREAAKSSLTNRSMRTSGMNDIPTAIADLSIAYITLLKELNHLASAQIAVADQIKDLTEALYGAPRDLVDDINQQLERMQSYSRHIMDTLTELLSKFQTVLFFMRQVEHASKLQDNLTQFDRSAVDAIATRLPSIMADVAQEIDRLYQEVDIQIDLLDGTDEIERLLAKGRNAE